MCAVFTGFGAAAAGAALAARRETLSAGKAGALQLTFVTGLHAASVVCAAFAAVGVITALVPGKESGTPSSKPAWFVLRENEGPHKHAPDSD